MEYNKKVSEYIKSLPQSVDIEVGSFSQEDLNRIYITREDESKNNLFNMTKIKAITIVDVSELREIENHDPSYTLRYRAIIQGYVVRTIMAVYHKEWMMDNYALIAEKNGILYRIATSHGALNIQELS